MAELLEKWMRIRDKKLECKECNIKEEIEKKSCHICHEIDKEETEIESLQRQYDCEDCGEAMRDRLEKDCDNCGEGTYREDKELCLLLFEVLFFKQGFGDVYCLLFCQEQVAI